MMSLLLADGRFPAGAHANSAGAEAAVRYGDVTDVATLERYLAGRLGTSGVVDAAFAARACAADGLSVLAGLDAEYDARTASPRLRAVSRQMGRRLVRAARTVWPHRSLDDAAAVPGGCHQAIALGFACAAAGGEPADAVALTLHHLSGAAAGAAVRMLGLDPLAVAAVQAAVLGDARGLIANAGEWACADPVDLPGVTSTLTEILAEDHGQWDARLFVA